MTATLTRPGPRGGRRRIRRRRRVAGSVAVVVVLVAAFAVFRLTASSGPMFVDSCTVTAPSGTFMLDPTQAANASTIAAVGIQEGLPDHAVTIALAAALQESKLQNLDYGDRDSIGLFQQRPSEGWGTPAQLIDPNYASAAFYRGLERVPGWETMAVTDAAQAVQRSAAPSAYAAWESEARSLAEAFTGEAPAALACHLHTPTAPAPTPTLASAIHRDLGPSTSSSPATTKQGWALASWLVAHASTHGIEAVSYDGQVWTAKSGVWQTSEQASNQVMVRVVGSSAPVDPLSI